LTIPPRTALEVTGRMQRPAPEFNPIPSQSISMFILAPAAMLIGVLIGYLLFF
jgi:hypothetical protein